MSARHQAPTSNALDEHAIAALGERLRGQLLRPEELGYDPARQIWNAMIDRRPALIARCTSAADVGQAVRFARKHDLLVSIRGGGHNIAGSAICDDGLMIDLSLMKGVQVDPAARRASVEAGCTLADFDAAAQAHGLATPLGINSTTGVAGLTSRWRLRLVEPQPRHDGGQPAVGGPRHCGWQRDTRQRG